MGNFQYVSFLISDFLIILFYELKKIMVVHYSFVRKFINSICLCTLFFLDFVFSTAKSQETNRVISSKKYTKIVWYDHKLIKRSKLIEFESIVHIKSSNKFSTNWHHFPFNTNSHTSQP